MLSPFSPGVGGVLSADIAVPDHEREVRFYSSVLTTGSAPLWRDDLSNNRGQPIIGLGARVPEYESLPLQWMPHFQVADVAASAARTLELGGQEVMHGRDAEGRSEWAVLVDPGGAAFGIIPVVDDPAYGADPPETIGCIAGLSLVAADVSSIGAFYASVLGGSVAPSAIEGRLELRRPDGVAGAELCPLDDGTRGFSSAWILGLPVGDLAESLRRVRENGGEVVAEGLRADHAVIRDPVGVVFAVQSPL